MQAMDQLEKVVDFWTLQHTMSQNPASTLPIFNKSKKKSRKRSISSIQQAAKNVSLPKATKRSSKVKRSSPAWEHYVANDEKMEARCKYCDKFIMMTNSSTSGLIRHLKSMHNIDCQDKQTQTDENAPPQPTVVATITSVMPLELADLKPAVQDSSFDSELAELLDTAAPSVSCPKDKLLGLINRLYAVYVAIKDFPMLCQMMMMLMDIDTNGDLDTGLTHTIAAKYGIATAAIEDASPLASSIFLGTVAFDHINIAIEYGAIRDEQCFLAEDKAVIEQVCDQLIASD